RFEFGDTYENFGTFSQPNVTCAAVFNGRIYVGTSSGLAISNPGASNLAAPVSWNSFATPAAVNAITVCYGSVYAGTNSGVYVYQNGTWQILPGTPQTAIALMNIASVLYIASTNSIVELSSANTVLPYSGAAPATITCAASDSSNRVFVGFQEAGIGILNSGT